MVEGVFANNIFSLLTTIMFEICL
jgi:AT-rich interactive domain-containing protein 2